MLETIKNLSGNTNVSLKQLDLSQQDNIKNFVAEFLSEHTKLHYLVNNAGLFSKLDAVNSPKDQERPVTAEGYDMTMASNFFGQTILTEFLMPRLKETSVHSTEPVRSVKTCL